MRYLLCGIVLLTALILISRTANSVSVINARPIEDILIVKGPITFSSETLTDKILDTFHTVKAVKIAMCESGLDPSKININSRTKDHSVGLFQINLYGELSDSRPSQEWLLNEDNNIEFAYELYLKDGLSFKEWTCNKKIAP